MTQIHFMGLNLGAIQKYGYFKQLNSKSMNKNILLVLKYIYITARSTVTKKTLQAADLLLKIL